MEVGASLPDIPPAAEHNNLSPGLVQYIQALSEPLSIYTRYMDALLIKRSDHAAFFRDLKAFRCQPHIMTLLTTPSSTPTFNSREMYLNVTSSFLASRFAHPWCQTSQLKSGGFKAGWSSSKKLDEVKQREEQRLHKLLVPIWCGFRVRMMPSDEVLEKFVQDEKEKKKIGETEEEDRRRRRLVKGKSEEEEEEEEEDDDDDDEEDAAVHKRSINGAKELAEAKPQKQPKRINAEAYCMELSDEDDGEGSNTLPASQQDDASAAAKLFVGVAATGFLANNRRARKYLLKKLNKR